MPIPSYATLVQENNVPSYATPVNGSSQNSPGTLAQIGNAVAPGLGNISSILGIDPTSIPHAALDVLKSVPRAAADVAANLSPLAPFSPAANFLPQAAAAVPTPSLQTSNMLGMAANVVPLARTAAELPELANLGAQLGKNGLRGLQRIFGVAATQKANNFISDLLQGNNFSGSHLPVLNELRKNYDAAQSQSNLLYNNILKEAADEGYTGGKQFSGISVNTGEKSINPTDFTNQLSQIDLDGQPKSIQNLLSPFKESVNNNLSFSDAHDLQSELGKQGAKLQTSADGTQRYLGGELLSLRDTLKNDITNNLAANGDTDLAHQYQNASDYFKTNVAPYRENSTIRKVVMGSGLKEINPANIGNVLKKDDGAILPIANNLSDQSKNLLLANELKSSTQQLPTKSGELERNANPTDLINAYGNLDNKGLAYLRTPEATAKIASIMGDLSRQHKLAWASGIAVPAAIGAVGAKHLF